MKKTDFLTQMGIQQWHLRDPLRVDGLKVDDVIHREVTENIDQGVGNKDNVSTHEIDPVKQASNAVSAEINTFKKAELVKAQAPIVDSFSSNSEEDIKTSETTQPLPRNYDWTSLIELLNDKSHCSSCSKVTPILGEGNITADWMFVFDSPTNRDIENQQLLTGRIGQLFDAILIALNLDRESVYLSSIFKCPPTESVSDDVAQCADLLIQQIQLIDPKVVITFGEFTAQALIKANEGLDFLRKQENTLSQQDIRVVPTYGLAQILDSPSLKMNVWADFKKAFSVIES